MLCFVTDEDFNARLLSGVQRRLTDLNIVRVQDVGYRTAGDSVILIWAAREGRLMLTHDASTMPDAAYQRVAEGLPMPGVVVVNKNLPLGLNISEIALLASASLDNE